MYVDLLFDYQDGGIINSAINFAQTLALATLIAGDIKIHERNQTELNAVSLGLAIAATIATPLILSRFIESVNTIVDGIAQDHLLWLIVPAIKLGVVGYAVYRNGISLNALRPRPKRVHATPKSFPNWFTAKRPTTTRFTEQEWANLKTPATFKQETVSGPIPGPKTLSALGEVITPPKRSEHRFIKALRTLALNRLRGELEPDEDLLPYDHASLDTARDQMWNLDLYAAGYPVNKGRSVPKMMIIRYNIKKLKELLQNPPNDFVQARWEEWLHKLEQVAAVMESAEKHNLFQRIAKAKKERIWPDSK